MTHCSRFAVRRGIVKWFSAREEYGFVIPNEDWAEIGDVLIFPQNYYGVFPAPSPAESINDKKWLGKGDFPEEGDEIVYIPEETHKGWRAKRWTLAEEFDELWGGLFSHTERAS